MDTQNQTLNTSKAASWKRLRTAGIVAGFGAFLILFGAPAQFAPAPGVVAASASGSDGAFCINAKNTTEETIQTLAGGKVCASGSETEEPSGPEVEARWFQLDLFPYGHREDGMAQLRIMLDAEKVDPALQYRLTVDTGDGEPSESLFDNASLEGTHVIAYYGATQGRNTFELEILREGQVIEAYTGFANLTYAEDESFSYECGIFPKL